MHIPAAQISYRRKIGRAGRRAVFGIGTIGGLHVVAASGPGGGLEILGTGSHPGIAKFIAQRHAADLEFDEMAKAEALDPKYFMDLVPQWEEFTNQLRAVNGDR